MEFPDLSTNVWKLDGLSEISWTFYALNDDSQYDYYDDVSEVEQTSSLHLDLLRVENQLRSNGNFVLIDLDRDGLWAFNIFGSDGKLPTEAESLGLIPSSHGNLRAQDLVGSPNVAAQSSRTHGDLNSKNAMAFSQNLDIPSRRNNAIESPKNANPVYGKLIHAIGRSLASALAQQDKWLLLDSDTCINEGSSEASTGPSYSSSLQHSNIVSFHPRWSPSGSLFISLLICEITQLRRSSNRLGSQPTSLLVSGAPVLLVPSGLCGTFREAQHSRKRHDIRSSSNSNLAFVSTYLQAFGLTISKNSQWLRVELDVDIGIKPDLAMDQDASLEEKTHILWPAEYCLCKSSQSYNRLKEIASHQEESSDPIERAQTWYNSRSDRAKVIEEAKATLAADARVRVAEKRFADEDAMHVVSPIDHRMNIQDPSGVYPTPPDGLESRGHDTPMNSDAPNHNSESLNEEHETFAETPYQYHHQDQDLFEDNDITEADFEFFDEPEAEVVLSASLGITADAAIAVSGAEDVETQDSAMIGVQAVMKSSDSTINPVNKPKEKQLSPSSDFHKIGGRCEMADQGAEPEIPQTTPVHPLTREKTSVTPDKLNEHKSITEVSFHQQANLDDKYSVTGRFGSLAHQSHLVRHARKDAPPRSRALPELGLLEGSASDSEETFEHGPEDNMSTSSLEDVTEDNLGNERQIRNVMLARLKASKLTTRHDIAMFLDHFAESREENIFVSTDQDFIRIAQVLVDQVVTASSDLKASNELSHGPTYDATHTTGFQGRDAKKTIQDLFPCGKLCRLYDLALQSTQSTSDKHPVDLPRGSSIVRLDHPLASVRRIGLKMDMLPAALATWEELGLAPVSQSKDLIAFCIPPRSMDYLDSHTERFLQMMKDAYQSCNLGTHDNIEDQDRAYKTAFHEGYESFGNKLAKLAHGSSTLVVYLINRNLEIPAPPDLCVASMSILEGYHHGMRGSKTANPADLVVQFVSQEFIFSSEHLVILPSAVYKNIAFEVYDRCPPVDLTSPSLPYMSAPAAHLARTIPQKIDFQLTADPLSASLHTDNRVHLAYAWRPDRQWLTVSWIDTVGVLQWNAAYWVGDNQQPWQCFREVVNEIVATTYEMLRPQNRAWRLFIIREGPYITDELAAWQDAVADLGGKSRTCIYLSVDQTPVITFSTPPVIADNPDESISNILTPASTPNALGQSPDGQSTTAQAGTMTGFDQDLNMRLIDTRDESWIFIPVLGAEDANLQSKFCCPSQTAYLLKHANATGEGAVNSLSVSTVDADTDDGSLLTEVLGMLHNLICLARIRNRSDSAVVMLPLHLGMALRAYMALDATMQFHG